MTTGILCEAGCEPVVSPTFDASEYRTFERWRRKHALDARFSAPALAAELTGEARTAWLIDRKRIEGLNVKAYGILVGLPDVVKDVRVANILEEDVRFNRDRDGRALFQLLCAPADFISPPRIALMTKRLAAIHHAANDHSGQGVKRVMTLPLTINALKIFLESFWYMWRILPANDIRDPRAYILDVLNLLKQVPEAAFQAKLMESNINSSGVLPPVRDFIDNVGSELELYLPNTRTNTPSQDSPLSLDGDLLVLDDDNYDDDNEHDDSLFAFSRPGPPRDRRPPPRNSFRGRPPPAPHAGARRPPSRPPPSRQNLPPARGRSCPHCDIVECGNTSSDPSGCVGLNPRRPIPANASPAARQHISLARKYVDTRRPTSIKGISPRNMLNAILDDDFDTDQDEQLEQIAHTEPIVSPSNDNGSFGLIALLDICNDTDVDTNAVAPDASCATFAMMSDDSAGQPFTIFTDAIVNNEDYDDDAPRLELNSSDAADSSVDLTVNNNDQDLPAHATDTENDIAHTMLLVHVTNHDGTEAHDLFRAIQRILLTTNSSISAEWLARDGRTHAIPQLLRITYPSNAHADITRNEPMTFAELDNVVSSLPRTRTIIHVWVNRADTHYAEGDITDGISDGILRPAKSSRVNATTSSTSTAPPSSPPSSSSSAYDAMQLRPELPREFVALLHSLPISSTFPPNLVAVDEVSEVATAAGVAHDFSNIEDDIFDVHFHTTVHKLQLMLTPGSSFPAHGLAANELGLAIAAAHVPPVFTPNDASHDAPPPGYNSWVDVDVHNGAAFGYNPDTSASAARDRRYNAHVAANAVSASSSTSVADLLSAVNADASPSIPESPAITHAAVDCDGSLNAIFDASADDELLESAPSPPPVPDHIRAKATVIVPGRTGFDDTGEQGAMFELRALEGFLSHLGPMTAALFRDYFRADDWLRHWQTAVSLGWFAENEVLDIVSLHIIYGLLDDSASSAGAAAATSWQLADSTRTPTDLSSPLTAPPALLNDLRASPMFQKALASSTSLLSNHPGTFGSSPSVLSSSASPQSRPTDTSSVGSDSGHVHSSSDNGDKPDLLPALSSTTEAALSARILSLEVALEAVQAQANETAQTSLLTSSAQQSRISELWAACERLTRAAEGHLSRIETLEQHHDLAHTSVPEQQPRDGETLLLITKQLERIASALQALEVRTQVILDQVGAHSSCVPPPYDSQQGVHAQHPPTSEMWRMRATPDATACPITPTAPGTLERVSTTRNTAALQRARASSSPLAAAVTPRSASSEERSDDEAFISECAAIRASRARCASDDGVQPRTSAAAASSDAAETVTADLAITTAAAVVPPSHDVPLRQDRLFMHSDHAPPERLASNNNTTECADAQPATNVAVAASCAALDVLAADDADSDDLTAARALAAADAAEVSEKALTDDIEAGDLAAARAFATADAADWAEKASAEEAEANDLAFARSISALDAAESRHRASTHVDSAANAPAASPPSGAIAPPWADARRDVLSADTDTALVHADGNLLVFDDDEAPSHVWHASEHRDPDQTSSASPAGQVERLASFFDQRSMPSSSAAAPPRTGAKLPRVATTPKIKVKTKLTHRQPPTGQARPAATLPAAAPSCKSPPLRTAVIRRDGTQRNTRPGISFIDKIEANGRKRIMVRAVTSHSLAAAAGVTVDDEVITINGTCPSSSDDAMCFINQSPGSVNLQLRSPHFGQP